MILPIAWGDGGCRCRRRYRRRRQSLLDDDDDDELDELGLLDELVELELGVLLAGVDSLLDDDPLPPLSEELLLPPLSDDELVDAAVRDDEPRLSVL